MIVLGFDTATASTVVALRLADASITEARDDPRAGEHPGHATKLLDMAAQLLSAAGVSWGEVQRVAVGVGPGTFTGLRVGVATARGLAQSLSVELVGISSLQALAAVALADAPQTVLAVIDARRGEVFAAAYRRGPDGVPVELTEPRALAPQDIASLTLEAGHDREELCGWLAVGDGAIRFRTQLEGAAIPTPPDASALHLLSAAAICRLGVHVQPAPSLQEIVPDYRRRPDAELALETAAQGSAAEP